MLFPNSKSWSWSLSLTNNVSVPNQLHVLSQAYISKSLARLSSVNQDVPGICSVFVPHLSVVIAFYCPSTLGKLTLASISISYSFWIRSLLMTSCFLAHIRCFYRYIASTFRWRLTSYYYLALQSLNLTVRYSSYKMIHMISKLSNLIINPSFKV